MRLAFIIQSHGDTKQLLRLIRILKTGIRDCLIYVAHNGDTSSFRAMPTPVTVDYLEQARVHRGQFSLLEIYLTSLSFVEKNWKPDWIVHLSGQDFPVRPLVEFKRHLSETSIDGFFYHRRVGSDSSGCDRFPLADREVHDRYAFQYRLLARNIGRFGRAFAIIPRWLLARSRRYRLQSSYGLQIGFAAKETPFTETFACYVGSYWQILNKRAARRLLERVEQCKAVRSYYERTIVPDESYIQSLLLNEQDIRIEKSDLRYYTFKDGRHGAARVLDWADLAAIRESGCFFARKFDMKRNPSLIAHFEEIACAEGVTG